MSMEGADVIVIGGGIHGCSSAFHLASRGARVVLLEAEYCGRHASGVNAGGVRTLGRPLPEIPLALASRALWHQLHELLGDNGDFEASGQLKVAEREDEVEILRQRVGLLNRHGWKHEVLVDRETVLALIPAITPTVAGGIWVEEDGHAVPFRAVMAFRRAAEARGAVIHENCPVTRLEQAGARLRVATTRGTFEAERVVNAAGAWAARIACQVGEEVPATPGGLMLMVTQRVAPFIKPVLGAAVRPLSFKQFDNGTVVIGGALECSVDFEARHAELDFARLSKSARIVTDLFPFLKNVGINRAWSGVEAFTPDKLPVIGASRKAPGLVHAFGFSASGFQLGPIVGKLVSELILDGRPSLPLDAFAVDRFGATA
jgi:sarcosine oxidase subunit beta